MSIRSRAAPGRKPRRTAAGEAPTPAEPAPRISGALFDPVDREPAYTRVSSAIEQKILSKVLRDGELLPPETDLAQQFRVHRSTVREALRQLESAGLVRRPPGTKRLIVSRPHAAKVASGMRQAFVLHGVSFVDVWEAMMVIEPEVAALAAVRRSQAELTALTELHEAFRASPLGDTRAVAIVASFFETLGAAARNHVLVLAKQSLTDALAPSLAQMIDRVPQARSRIVEAQRRLIAALQARDGAEARKWMAKHVRDFRRGYEVAGISPDTPVSV
jgi:GntR family transcriptional regulator, transcriptional repressor for pyruvate dehydrogenase complex